MKFVKEFIVPAAVLTIICVVVSAALVLTYDTTKPIIEAAKAAEADAARAVVLTGGEKFEKQNVKVEDVVEAYKAGNGAGYVVTAKAKGYGGDLFVMVGIKADGKIDSVKLMDNKETAGLGTQTGEAKYTDRYKGKTGNDVDSVEAISGATVSSYAFRHAVKQALLAYGELAGVTFEEPKTPEQMIFPDVESFEESTAEGAVKVLKSGDSVIIVTEAQGYSGAPSKMQVYTGFGADGKIVGVFMGENTETQGIGSKVNDEAYRSQYVGKDSADGVDAVSGATESSDGFNAAVKKAVEIYKTLAGGAAADAAPADASSEAPAESSSEAPVASSSEAPAKLPAAPTGTDNPPIGGPAAPTGTENPPIGGPAVQDAEVSSVSSAS